MAENESPGKGSLSHEPIAVLRKQAYPGYTTCGTTDDSHGPFGPRKCNWIYFDSVVTVTRGVETPYLAKSRPTSFPDRW